MTLMHLWNSLDGLILFKPISDNHSFDILKEPFISLRNYLMTMKHVV